MTLARGMCQVFEHRITQEVPGTWHLVVVPVVCAAAMYVRFFAGYWLGDDLALLYQASLADRSGELWRQAWMGFFAGAPSQSAFYRPMMFASIFANEWFAGSVYAGWFAINIAIHLANVVLVGVLAARLAAACGRDGRASSVAAALFFGLCPLIAEGVFWIAARAD